MEASKIRLRPVNLVEDIQAIYELEQNTFAEEAFELEDFPYFYHIGAKTFWVAYDDKQLAGYVIGNIKGNEGYIASIAIHADYRQQGLAVRLMREIMSLISEDKNAEYIRLHVRQSNAAAIALYQKLGFTIEDSETDYYPDHEAAYRMVYMISHAKGDK
jgi:[ribosomal protein S18]-alanine N-acetyltransferase